MEYQNKILICDGNALAHRAIHTVGNLRYGKKQTGVLYGFFQQLFTILEKYKPDIICFVWDSKKSLRKEIFPSYKEKRLKKKKAYSKEEKEFYRKCFEQFDELYDEVLPKLGFKNNFKVSGLEGDDLIASICLNNKGNKIIATSDNDLYQLLDGETEIYDIRNKKPFTCLHFENKYKISSINWVKAKCIAGCSSDEVPGIKGVGINTAIKFLNGKLKETAKTYKNIHEDIHMTFNRNFKLIKLPFEGTPKLKIQEKDKIDIQELKSFFLDNGFDSFCNKIKDWRRLLCQE